MAKDAMRPTPPNEIDDRALWLRRAYNQLKPDFEEVGLILPENIRFGFSTKGKGTKKTGETWHSPASADGYYQIFVRADQGDVFEILGILVRELVHAALPPDKTHGKRFKAAASKIGLAGKMNSAVPETTRLQKRLHVLADDLGPIPHGALDINWLPIARSKPQVARMLKASCRGAADPNGVFHDCGYTVRIAAKWIREVGAPVCPLHGQIAVEIPDEEPEPDLKAAAE